MAEEIGILVKLREKRRFIADTKDAAGGIKGMGEAGEKAASRLDRAGERMGKVGKKATMFLTLPLLGVAAAAVTMASDVDKGLREVNTLLGETGAAGERNLGELRTLVQGLSEDIGIAQSVITGGLYQAISAGVPKENALEFMRVASKASIAGVTDVETAVDGMTSIVNAFGLDFADAGAVADSVFTAVAGGKTTFEEMSAAIFNVAPAAAAAKVSMEEVNAAIATLTKGGTPTSVATTQIRAALTGLQRPSAEMNTIFGELGFKNAQAAIESKGLAFALGVVKKASAGDTGAMQKLLGSTEAVAAAQVIAGTGAATMAEQLALQEDKAGATQRAFEEMERSTARKFERMKVDVQNLAIAVGEDLLPYVAQGVGFISKLTGAMGALNPKARGVVLVMAGLVAVLGPALIITSKLITAYGVLRKNKIAVAIATKAWAVAQRILNFVMKQNPIWRVIMLLALLAAGFVLAYKKVGWFRGAVQATWSWIKDHWPLLLAILTGPFGLAVLAITRNLDTIKEKLRAVIDWIAGKFTAMWDALPGPVKWFIKRAAGGVMGGSGGTAEETAQVNAGLAAANAAANAPGAAAGGIVRSLGRVLVGEKGPEVLTLAPPARVDPLPPGETVIHNHIHLDGREIHRSVIRREAYAAARA